MPDTATVPLTITPEAAARIAELGMQSQFEQMLEHTRQTIPGLRALHVSHLEPYDIGGGSRVIIDATMDDPLLADDPTEREWGFWVIRTFPPEVCEHFHLFCDYGANNAR